MEKIIALLSRPYPSLQVSGLPRTWAEQKQAATPKVGFPSGFLMIDVDAPSPQAPRFSPFLHWMAILSTDKPEVPYIPPNPPSGIHRYFLLRLQFTDDKSREAFVRDRQSWMSLGPRHRQNFPLLSFLSKYGFQIAGLEQFRCCTR